MNRTRLATGIGQFITLATLAALGVVMLMCGTLPLMLGRRRLRAFARAVGE